MYSKWDCIIVVIFLIALNGCINKPKLKSRCIDIKGFRWSFEIQADSKLKDSSFDSDGRIIQDYQKIVGQEMLSLFRIENSPNDWFSSVIIKDSLSLTDWEATCDADNEWYFKQVSLNSKIKIIDTVYSNDIIDKVSFKKEYIKYYNYIQKDTIWRYHYYGKFKQLELAISFTFANNTIGKSYFEILRSSKFFAISSSWDILMKAPRYR